MSCPLSALVDGVKIVSGKGAACCKPAGSTASGRRSPKGTTPVATLNGTLCAAARTIACLLDHHQQPDGSVYVPAALRPFLGGRELLSAP